MTGAVLITGGARRLGAAMARAIANAGYIPVIHANHSAIEARALAAELGGHAILADLSDPAAPEKLILEAIAKAGPLYGLINNASRFEFDLATTVTNEAIAAHAGTNLTAPVLLTRL